MRPLACLSVLVAVVALSAGCANPSLDSEADDLRSQVADLPGVTSATLDYSEPVTLDSGKLVLTVEMDDAATPDEVVAVTETAYRAFSSTHESEEADLSVRAGGTTLALRAFEPEASVGAVADAVRTGLTATPAAGSVTIDLTTQDVDAGDHVAGTYVVTLPEASTFADVPELLESLAADAPESDLIGWGAAAADGSSLSFDKGFPPAEITDRWQRLQSADLPLAVRAFEDGAVLTEGRLPRHYDVDDPAERRALDAITHRQLRVLAQGEWSYTLLGPGGGYVADVDRFVCAPTSEGAYDDALEAWVTEEFGSCEAE